MTTTHGAAHRQKGKQAELQIVGDLKSSGDDEARRSGDSGQIDGDITNSFGLYIEVRRRETIEFWKWTDEVRDEEQALADRGIQRRLPVLVTRRSRGSWKVAMEWSYFLRLIRFLRNRGLLKEAIEEVMGG